MRNTYATAVVALTAAAAFGIAVGFAPGSSGFSAAFAQGQGSGQGNAGGGGAGGQGGQGGQNSGQNMEQNREQNREQETNRNRERERERERNRNREGTEGLLTLQQAQSLTARVCFFDNPDYAGEAFCAGEGAYSSALTALWDNRISSIQITGGSSTTVCTDPGYAGTCMTFSASVPRLADPLNDAISSFEID